ncbi:hypothetical protein C8Q75DRAFT_808486 [Abortiporus biennis]|nr:hypothetical protein C8Q75DRAFT_808486 [Abortiporus biennis]
MPKWEKVGRFSLDAAATTSSIGFAAAKTGVKLGFFITRGVASTAANITGTVIDHALFGGTIGAGPMIGGAVSTAVSTIESLSLLPILVGETITSTSLVAANSSLSVLQTIFPGSDEASFSLSSFVTLVQREWHCPPAADGLPPDRFGITSIMKGLVAWSALQGMTSQWHEENWLRCLDEVRSVHQPTSLPTPKRNASIHITTDVIYPNNSGQVITADIGHASSTTSMQHDKPDSDSMNTLLTALRRYSKLVLAGYGGASLLFFGVPPIPSSGISSDMAKSQEEANLNDAISATQNNTSVPSAQSSQDGPGTPSYSWWNVLLGRHDHDIVRHYATAGQESSGTEIPHSIVEGTSEHIPRFWILTDHGRQEVVLVIRGTMSLNELAVDLTCDPADFEVKTSQLSFDDIPKQDDDDDEDFPEELMDNIPGSFPIDIDVSTTEPEPRATSKSEEYESFSVHGGMLKLARAMGGRGKPVHTAVRHALRRNPDYSLVICGHSLGAGVAALLALMWADLCNRQTHTESGLPVGRGVSAYCFAPPCLVDSRLCALSAKSGLITSFVYSHDVVSRLSLGSIRDLTRVASWLCEAEREGKGEGYTGVTKRALKMKAGLQGGDDKWFLSIRKTLEANMRMAHLYPPGRVLWAMNDNDLHPSHRLNEGKHKEKKKPVRLFEVSDVTGVFGQIVFARDMLSSHMPHQYDQVLDRL